MIMMLRNFGDLFSSEDFNEFSRRLTEDITKEIYNYNHLTILNTPSEDLIKKLEEKHTLRVPIIKINDIYLPNEPEEVIEETPLHDEVSGELVNERMDYIQFTICVPFEGDQRLLRVRPNSYSITIGSRKVDAVLEGREIKISYRRFGSSGDEDIENVYTEDIEDINSMLGHLQED